MQSAREILSALNAAKTVNEYLSQQSRCIATISLEELQRIASDSGADPMWRRDCLQVIYWQLGPELREQFFADMLRKNPAHVEFEMLKGLAFRAVVEKQVQLRNPERLEKYRENVKREYAESLFSG